MLDRHTDPANPLATLYDPVETTIIPFDDGSKPSFISETVSGGGSVSYQTTEGGYASLSTGTTSTGDSAEVTTGDVSIGPHDALSFSVVFSAVSGTISNTNSFLQLNFTDGGILHYLSRIENNLKATDGTNDDVTDTMRRKDETLPKRSTMLWDPSEDVIYHRFHNSFAAKLSSTYPDPNQTAKARVYIETQDTSADRVLEVRQLEIGYWNRSR